MTQAIGTLETPVKTGKKRFNVKDVCAFYGVDYAKAAALPWSDRNELINRHYDEQSWLRKSAQILKMQKHIAVIQEQMDLLSPSKQRLEDLLKAIK
mgnify:FL=1